MMMFLRIGFAASSACVMAGLGMACLLSTLGSSVAAQPPEPATSISEAPPTLSSGATLGTGAYRRVYIRDTDLPVEGFRAMDLSSFKNWIQEWSKRDPMAPGYEPELRAFHSQVRLLGADLIADRSRLRWNWDPANRRGRSSIRKSIAPWSPAIDTSLGTNESSGSSLLLAPTWMYDSSGTPSVRITSEEDWFSWTLRPQQNSTPNRLNYAMSFPRTADSCMVLQLPKTARVVDANAVVRSAGTWNEVMQRLGEWPVALAAPETVPELNANDAFWLLELSGLDQANFSILLGENRTLSDSDLSLSPSVNVKNRLIARQNISHSITSQYIKTRCEWEWNETTSLDRSFRLHLPEGMRLRNLTINEQETALKFSNRIIEVVIPTLDSSTTSTAPATTSLPRTKVAAEFLSTLNDLTSQGTVTIPPIECLNAYVVSGNTTLQTEDSVELRNVQSKAGRLESLRTTNGSPDKWDYSWFQTPPPVSLEVASRKRTDRAELLARLSTDSERAIAVVKVQLSPWHAAAPKRIQIGRRWTVESAQINHKGLELTFDDVSTDEGIPPQGASFRIDRTGPVDAGPVMIEMQLVRDMSSGTDESLEDEPLILFPERRCDEVAVIEPGYASRWVYTGDYTRDLCDEETLTPWQRERLPRLGKFLLFRMQAGRLPSLQWKPEPTLLECSIDTKVSDRGEFIHIEHILDLRANAADPQSAAIELPGTWRWEWHSPDGWRPLAASYDSTHHRWHFALSEVFKLDQPPPQKHRLRAQGRVRSDENPSELILPRLASGTPASRTLQSDSSLLIVPEDREHASWTFNQEGDMELRWNDSSTDESKIRFSVRSNQPKRSNRWLITRSDLHVAVDASGQQRAVMHIEAEGMSHVPWECEMAVPEGWSIERLIDDKTDTTKTSGRGDTYSYRSLGERLLIRRPSNGEDPSTSRTLQFSVVLAGPALTSESFLEWGLVPTNAWKFPWPQIGIQSPVADARQFLWLPRDLQWCGPPKSRLDWAAWQVAPLPKVDGVWSPWAWTEEASSWLIGGPRTATTESLDSSLVPPRELLPPWIATDWIPMAVPLEATKGNPSNPMYPEHHEAWTLRPKLSVAGPMVWLVVIAVITTSLLKRTPWFVLLVACMAAVGGHWLPEPIAIWFRSTWVGLGTGSVLYLVRWISASNEIRPVERHHRPDQWHPWNEPGLSIDGVTDGSGSGRAAIVASLSVLFLTAMGLPLLSQEIASSRRANSEAVFDVLIPLDADGNAAGEVIYVPSSVATLVESDQLPTQAADRDSYLISAKHNFRFDARSVGFGNTEQPCNYFYEVWIGETGVGRPWRIPFPADRSRLSRFLVDGIEVASSRLVKSDTELLWYPERSGRRTLQIESQLRIRPLERDKSSAVPQTGLLTDLRPPRGWGIDVPILPAANAVFEVETDSGWAVDFNSRGRISNPSIGKFSIQLGGLDRLLGEITTIANQASRNGGSPASDPTTLASPESPQMNTELFIDREQLMARTILEYPRASDPPTEIEIESDVQWQPIGNRWGDAQLIDVRPGSTLDRRRYIVRWSGEPTTTTGKRLVTTTWIPVGDINLRNVLFAECRDRRVRPNTLRYARSAGSIWTLEGINTWVPSINTKERIDWQELKERPIATSLKIPMNGGFGVLRQQTDSKLQRVRVSQQWHLGPSKISVRSKLELAAPVNNRRSMILTVPSVYEITKVSSRNTNLLYSDWVAGDRRKIQVFLDREIGDVSELQITSEQDVSSSNMVEPATPYLEVEGLTIAEQYAELSADPVWRVTFLGETEPVKSTRGQGTSKTLSTMLLQGGSGDRSIRIERLQGEWMGSVIAKVIAESETEMRWRLSMVNNASIDARPALLVSLPIDLCRQWFTNDSIKEIPSLDPTRRLLQIQPQWNLDNQTATLEVDWIADPANADEVTWFHRILFPSDPKLQCESEPQPQANALVDKSVKDTDTVLGETADTSGSQKAEREDATTVLEVHERMPPWREGRNAIVHSTVWTDLASHRKDPEPAVLDWLLPAGAHVTWVSINGEGVSWLEQDGHFTVMGPPISIPVRIDVWTEVSEESEVVEPRQMVRPQLVHPHRSRVILIDQGRIEMMGGPDRLTWPEVWCETSEFNFVVMNALQRLRSDRTIEGISHTSRWEQWSECLGTDTLATLRVWARQGTPEKQACYAAAAGQYVDLAAAWPVDLRERVESRSQSHRVAQPEPTASAATDERVWNQSFDSNPPFLVWLMSHRTRLIATLCMMLLIVLAPWVWRTLGMSLQRSPWWQLVLIGGWIWIFAGTWIPGLILTALGLLLAIDTYRILNERFRQTGTRAPR